MSELERELETLEPSQLDKLRKMFVVGDSYAKFYVGALEVINGRPYSSLWFYATANEVIMRE